ncbi:MAG: FAD-dependent monooxygenase [Pyrinomonadaceae bacterium]
MNTEVLIIGAGPTGLALACQLVRHGIDFVIIDKKTTTTPHSKAIGVQARTLEIYEQYDISQILIEQGTLAGKARLVESGNVRGEVDLSNIGEGISPYPFLLLVEQGKHEKILHDFLTTNKKNIFWETELENFSQDEKKVAANLKNSAGENFSVEAKFLVGCDGAKSVVRHTLGMTFEGSTFERLFYVADVEIEWEFPHDSLYLFLMENNLLAFFPMVGGENHFRIVGTFPEGDQRREGEILYEEIEKQIIEDTQVELDIHDVSWFAVYKVHSRRVNKFSEGRCFLAGDAAHIHTPAGAQGMNTGIGDGYNLAWKLAYVLRGKADEKILETYNEERLENAKNLLKTTDRAFDFGASDEWFISFFRTRIFPYIANFALNFDAVKKIIFPLVSQIGINYRKSRLSVHNENFKVRAGDRMPYFMVDGASIYEKLKSPMFHLLTFSDGQTEMFAESETEKDSFYDYISFPLYPHVAEIFGCTKSFSVLLRPDNYIAMITEENSLEKINEYLHTR